MEARGTGEPSRLGAPVKVGAGCGADRCCVRSRQAGRGGGGGTYWTDTGPEPLGYIDNAVDRPPGGQVQLQGWGGDAGASARPVDVLMFQCGAFLGAAPAEGIRPEVATACRVSQQNFGFSATFSKQHCPQDRLAALILTQDQHYSVINVSTPLRLVNIQRAAGIRNFSHADHEEADSVFPPEFDASSTSLQYEDLSNVTDVLTQKTHYKQYGVE